jgi:hypothetical protein
LAQLLLLSARSTELDSILQYQGWQSRAFCVGFVLAASMGSVLNYSIFVCTSVNSALTTTVVGCLKNVLTTYLGMLMLGADYVYNPLNFAGLNISIAGSLVYSYAKYRESNSSKPKGGSSGSSSSSAAAADSSASNVSLNGGFQTAVNGGSSASSSEKGSKQERESLLQRDSAPSRSRAGSPAHGNSSSNNSSSNGASSSSEFKLWDISKSKQSPKAMV